MRGLLSEDPEMRDSSGKRRKVIIFTEYKDTLWLSGCATTWRDDAVIAIDGSTKRKGKARSRSLWTPDVTFLVAHLMQLERASSKPPCQL